MKGGAALTEPACDDSGSPSGSGSIPAPSLKTEKRRGTLQTRFLKRGLKISQEFPPDFVHIFTRDRGQGKAFFFQHCIGGTARTLAAIAQNFEKWEEEVWHHLREEEEE